ncbi:MAG: hypothetical protein H6724_03785 [Sandaracinus sp.]|nr:hypothetical protein [Sandaracinus sp.]MCB9618557.1 hypothetical protein [Sandaracinus sp.]
MPETKRVRGPLVVLGLAVLILGVVGFAFTMWWSKREPRGPIMAAAPIGEGDVALLRRGFEERGYVHLVVEDGPRQRWSEALFGVPESPSITRFGDHVVLRAREARGHVEVHAFDHATGEFRWRGGRGTHETPEENPQGVPAFAERSLFAVGETLFVVVGGPSPEVITLSRTGEELGRVELPGGEGARAAMPTGDALAIATGDGTLRVVARDGSVRELGALPHGWCATNDAIYVGHPNGLMRHRDGHEPELLGDGMPIAVHACEGDWLVVTAPSGERAMQRVSDEGLAGGFALPASLGTTDLRLVPGWLVAPCANGGFDAFALGATEATMQVDGADEIAFVGDVVVSRKGETVMSGETELAVPGAQGLGVDDAHVFVWTDHTLHRFDASLRPRD